MVISGFLATDVQWLITHAVILLQEWTNEP